MYIYIYKEHIYIEYIVHIFFNNKSTLKLSDIWLYGGAFFVTHFCQNFKLYVIAEMQFLV